MKTRKNDLKNLISSYKKAIAENCLGCVCCKPEDVLDCEIQYCPLWHFRPKSFKGLYILVKEVKEKNKEFFEAE